MKRCARRLWSFVWPAARRYQPQFVLCSAGFDGHVLDPLASWQLTSSDYRGLTAELVRLAGDLCGPGSIMFVLEGGYEIAALTSSVVASMRGIVDASSGLEPALGAEEVGGANEERLLQPEPMRKVQEALRVVKQLHKL